MFWNVMAILFLLLKIVGILLLILLLLLVLILFVPLRYRVSAAFYEEKRVRARVSWLCFVARAVFLWEDGETYQRLRVFGIPVLSGGGDGSASSTSKKNKRKKRNKKRKDAKNKQKVIENLPGDEDSQNVVKEQEEQEQTEKQTEEQSHASEDAESVRARSLQEETLVKPGKHRGIIACLRKLWEKIKNFFHTLRKLFRLLRQKVHSLRDLADLLREEEAKHAICIVKDNMIHLWKEIHPRKIRGDIVFGTGDPCTTGQALGGIAVLYGWIGTGVHIAPDFQEQRLEGRLDVRGRVRIITLIVIIVKIMFQKDFKQLWQKLEQWKEDF